MSDKDTKMIEGPVRIAPCAACGKVRQVSGEIVRDKRSGKILKAEGPRLCGVASCKRARKKKIDRLTTKWNLRFKRGKKQ